MNSVTHTSKLFRSCGILFIIIAAINYMVGGRYDLNRIDSHYFLLGINLLFTFLGLGMGKIFKEYKTARTFLSLSLAMVPVHMAQLGGFIYSRVGHMTESLPYFLDMRLPDNTSILVASLITGLTLIPIFTIGFKILDREHATKYSAIYLLSSLLILIPVRETGIIYSIILATLGSIYLFAIKKNQFKTTEKKVSMAILFIPSAIMFGRLAFYPTNALFYFILGTSILSITIILEKNSEITKLLKSVLITLTLVSTFIISGALENLFHFISNEMIFYIAGFLILLSSLLMKSVGKTLRTYSAVIFSLTAIITVNDSAFSWDQLYILFPLTSMFVSLHLKEKYALLVSSLANLILVIIIITQSFMLPSLGSWQSLTFIGVVQILAGGIYEKFKLMPRNIITEFFARLN